MSEQTQAERVFNEYMARWNRGDIDGVIAMLSDDAVAIGAAKCKGRPCRGKEMIRTHLVEPTITPRNGVVYGKMRVSIIDSDDHSLQAWYVVEGGKPWQGGMWIRGWLSFEFADGLITRQQVMYDLTDPETVAIRAWRGEPSFSLPDATGISLSDVRVLTKELAEAETALSIYYGRPGNPHEPANAHIYREDSRDTVFQGLTDIINNQSESVVPLPLEELLSGNFGLAVSEIDSGAVIARGQIPPLLRDEIPSE